MEVLVRMAKFTNDEIAVYMQIKGQQRLLKTNQ